MTFKTIGIIEIIWGIIGIFCGLMMVGDIGIACFVGALNALLSGIAFVSLSKVIKGMKERDTNKE